MRTIFLSAAAAATLISFAFGAHAFPTAPAAAGYENSGVILVEDRCGPGWFRGDDGRCRPDRHDRDRDRVIVAPILPPVVVDPPVVVVEPRGCPFGTHWSERFRRCILN